MNKKTNNKNVACATKKHRTIPTHFSEEFKKKIIAEYLESDLTKREILDKYGIRSNSPLQKWMRKYGIIDPYAKKDYLGVTNTLRLKKKKPEPSELELQNIALSERIKKLEKQLLDEKIRADMFARVIEVAETELNIPIRKKYDTK